MEMQKNKRKYLKPDICFAAVLIVTTFAAVGFALHDMQTSQGVGFYLSMLWGNADRTGMADILMDAFGMGSLLALLFFPCFLLQRRNVHSFFRLFAVYLALMPEMSLSDFVHLPDPPGFWEIRQAFLRGDSLVGLSDAFGLLMPVFRYWIPVISVLLVGKHLSGQKDHKKWRSVVLAVILALVVGVFLFQDLSPWFAFIIQYLLLILCFDIWETLYLRYPVMNIWGAVWFGGCWLRGIYKLIEISSFYHI